MLNNFDIQEILLGYPVVEFEFPPSGVQIDIIPDWPEKCNQEFNENIVFAPSEEYWKRIDVSLP